MKLFGFGKDPVESLWNYVRNHISSIDDIQKPAVQHGLTKALQAVNRDLSWGCGPAPDGTPVIEISASGLKQLIPVVKDLVSRAPSLPNVGIVAFKQPAAPGFALQTQHGNIDGEAMRWRSLGAENGVEGLEIFVPLPRHAPHEVLGEISFIFLDHTLGEYIVMTRVGELDFKSADDAPADTRPFRELPAHFGMPTP